MKGEEVNWEEYRQLGYKDHMIGYLNGLRDWEGEHEWLVSTVGIHSEMGRLTINFVCKTCNKSLPIVTTIQKLAEIFAYSNLEKFIELIETCPESCKHENEEKQVKKQWIFNTPDGKMEVDKVDLAVRCKDCGVFLRNEINQYTRDL